MRKKFKCLDCQVDTGKIGEYYFLHPEIWNAAHNSKKGMLCVGCIEKRLGRKLNASDFAECTLNSFKHGFKSARLTERLKCHILPHSPLENI